MHEQCEDLVWHRRHTNQAVIDIRRDIVKLEYAVVQTSLTCHAFVKVVWCPVESFVPPILPVALLTCVNHTVFLSIRCFLRRDRNELVDEHTLISIAELQLIMASWVALDKMEKRGPELFLCCLVFTDG